MHRQAAARRRRRYALAYDPPLCRAVLAVFVLALLTFERHRARGVVGRGGAVTAIQRCGSALNTNVHFHTLVAEGVFATAPDGALRFVATRRPPTVAEVGRLLAAVRRRIVRLVRRHGTALDAAGADGAGSDALALDAPALAAIAGASVLGRVATGPRAGHLVLRLGADATAPVVSTGGPRHAHRKGFDLHADVAVPAGDRRRLERLCRYVLRPPVAQGALALGRRRRLSAPSLAGRAPGDRRASMKRFSAALPRVRRVSSSRGGAPASHTPRLCEIASSCGLPAGYPLALMAAGRADGTFSLTPKHEWDICAGAALILAGGGRITDCHGGPLRFNREKPLLPGIIATNAALFEPIRAVIARVGKPAPKADRR